MPQFFTYAEEIESDSIIHSRARACARVRRRPEPNRKESVSASVSVSVSGAETHLRNLVNIFLETGSLSATGSPRDDPYSPIASCVLFVLILILGCSNVDCFRRFGWFD